MAHRHPSVESNENQQLSRRAFVGAVAALGVGVGVGASGAPPSPPRTEPGGTVPGRLPSGSPTPPLARAPLFRISLAEWSLHRALKSGQLDPAEFPKSAKHDYDIDAVEYVNVFLMKGYPQDTAPRDGGWMSDLRKRCDDQGVSSLLIMCDALGDLGDPDGEKRRLAVERHRPWLESAKLLGCHSIRVNAASRGTWEEQRSLAADGLRRLCEFADPVGLNVIVENHGGISSNGKWLAETIREVAHPRAGTLPDFGNFDLGNGTVYDRYQGVAELMPFAKGVSAKSHDFDAEGNERFTDYTRMIKLVLDAGYHGHIGIEYEGAVKSEPEGIRATKALLERVRGGLAAAGPG